MKSSAAGGSNRTDTKFPPNVIEKRDWLSVPLRISRRRVVVILLGTLGLALYLVPAVLAPVVRWGDSEPDLRWAREGIGLWKPLTAEEIRRAPVHSLKPGYLLFLRFASSAIPGNPERSIIVVQSLLLWLSIAGGCLRLGKQNGMAVGVAAYLLLLLFLPIRDSASAVMPEAISTAAFLPLCVVAWERPQGTRTVVLTALSVLALFWIRPNVGAVAFLLVALGWTLRTSYREVAGVAGVFFVGLFSIWAATAPYTGRDTKRGLPDPILIGSVEYNFTPALAPWPGSTGSFFADPRIVRSISNWKQTLAAPLPDRTRDLRWRAFHGILGVDYYDARWSKAYRHLEEASRNWVPLLVVFAVAVSLASVFAQNASDVAVGLCAWTLAGVLVFHDFLLGSSPRLVLPYLPFFFLLAPRAFRNGRNRTHLLTGALVLSSLWLLARHPEVASWDWGLLESSGATVEQRLAAGVLPHRAPATLHVRVAAPGPGSADLILALNGQVLFQGSSESMRKTAFLTIALPSEILLENLRAPFLLRLTSVGRYDSCSYLVFAVVPPLWRESARRLGNPELSPVTDVRSGSLDWWAHEGTDAGATAPAVQRN
jgi:hypothetical protein